MLPTGHTVYADTSFSQDGQCCLARGVSLEPLQPCKVQRFMYSLGDSTCYHDTPPRGTFEAVTQG